MRAQPGEEADVEASLGARRGEPTEAFPDPGTGAVDPEKTKAAVLEVMGARPHWRRPAVDIAQGPRIPTPTGRSFADVLREGAR